MPKEYGTPGPRAIYPDICTSRSVAACSVEAQLLFDRLLAQADDQGRVEGNIAILKSVCVPLVDKITTRNLNRLLGELEAEDLIFRYEAGRSCLTQVPTWWRWQQGMRRAYPSRWPAPDGWTDAVYGHGEGSEATYKTWLIAAPRGTAPHNAAFRGNPGHNAALSGELPRSRVGARAGAAPAAPAGAVAGASTVPDSPQPPASGGRPSRANGTNQRALAKAEDHRLQGEAKTKAWRRNQRALAYARGAITEGEQVDMDRRDAPLEEIPDWLSRLASLDASTVEGPTWLDKEPVEAES